MPITVVLGAIAPAIYQQERPGATTAESLIPDDSTTITGRFNPTGSLTVSLFARNDATCSGTAAFQRQLQVNGNSRCTRTHHALRSPFAASTSGALRSQVTYVGDANNQRYTGACGIESFTIAE
jgi:hypothetical protein